MRNERISRAERTDSPAYRRMVKLLAANLVRARKERKLTQAEVAEMLLVSQGHITHLECGWRPQGRKQTIALPMLFALSKLYGKDIGWFFQDHEIVERRAS